MNRMMANCKAYQRNEISRITDAHLKVTNNFVMKYISNDWNKVYKELNNKLG